MLVAMANPNTISVSASMKRAIRSEVLSVAEGVKEAAIARPSLSLPMVSNVVDLSQGIDGGSDRPILGVSSQNVSNLRGKGVGALGVAGFGGSEGASKLSCSPLLSFGFSSRHEKENVRPASRVLLLTGISAASLLRGQGGEAPTLSCRLVSQKFLANATTAEGLCSRESLLQGSLGDAAEDGSMKAMVMASPMLPPPIRFSKFLMQQ